MDVVRQQLDLRLARKKELLAEVELKKSDVAQKITLEEIGEAEIILENKIQGLELVSSSMKNLPGLVTELQSNREKLAAAEADEARVQTQLNRIKGLTPTQLVEGKDTLRLVYQDTVTSSDSAGLLVHTLPNEVPLMKQGKIFALGVEALLAYYGLEDDAVEIDDDYQTFRIVHPTEGALVESKLSDGQFLEVNWFSKWSEPMRRSYLLLRPKELMWIKISLSTCH